MAIFSKKNTQSEELTKFVIVSSERSGSNLLLANSHRHKNIRVFWEVFHPKQSVRSSFFDRVYLDGQDPIRFLRSIYHFQYDKEIQAVGFKLFYSHCRDENTKCVWDYLAKTKSVRIVHLIRVNLLAALVSLEKARHTGIWSAPKDEPEKRADFPSFPITPERCEKYFSTIEKQRERIHNLFKRSSFHMLTYEDLVHDKLSTLNRYYSFLGVNDINELPEIDIAKQATKQPAEQISNFDELKEIFSGTKYERYFKLASNCNSS
jgi:LPS sulfotransferase NodH